MSQFDLKKFLVENKLTYNSQIAEQTVPSYILRDSVSPYEEFIDRESIKYSDYEDLYTLSFTMTFPPLERPSPEQFKEEYTVRSYSGPGGPFYHQSVGVQELPDGGFTAYVSVRSGLDI